MSTINVQDIQDIAVQATSDFYNSQIPLSQGLAKIASERGLNSDQLRRAVEATNTLTYLKSLQVSGDRTGEFPLADYNEIIKMASVPDDLQGAFQEKTASEDPFSESFVKQANDSLAFTMPEMTQPEMLAILEKKASANRRALEDKEMYAIGLARSIVKTAAEVAKDDKVVWKLSSVAGNEEQFQKLAHLVFGPRALETKFSGYGEFVVEHSSLTKVAQLQDMVKEAEVVVAEIAQMKELDEQATRMEGMLKQAFLGAAAEAIGSGVGRLAGSVIGGIGRTAGNAALSGTKAVATGTGHAIARAGQNLLAGSKPGKLLRVPVKAKSLKATAVLAGAGALWDASLYQPKSNTSSTGDVWDAING